MLRQSLSPIYTQLNILPVKMHVDQDAIDFIKRFMSFSSRNEGHNLAQAPEASPAPVQFIREYHDATM